MSAIIKINAVKNMGFLQCKLLGDIRVKIASYEFSKDKQTIVFHLTDEKGQLHVRTTEKSELNFFLSNFIGSDITPEPFVAKTQRHRNEISDDQKRKSQIGTRPVKEIISKYTPSSKHTDDMLQDILYELRMLNQRMSKLEKNRTEQNIERHLGAS